MEGQERFWPGHGPGNFLINSKVLVKCGRVKPSDSFFFKYRCTSLTYRSWTKVTDVQTKTRVSTRKVTLIYVLRRNVCVTYVKSEKRGWSFSRHLITSCPLKVLTPAKTRILTIPYSYIIRFGFWYLIRKNWNGDNSNDRGIKTWPRAPVRQDT